MSRAEIQLPARPPVFLIGTHRGDAAEAGIEVLGSKAYGLMRMDRIGLRVPPAVVLGTAICRDYYAAGERFPEGFRDLLAAQIRRLEEATTASFGGARRPLLVSVRSGAAVSMPGMLETVLNVGLNDVTVKGLVRRTGNPRLAWDCYWRLVQSYAEVVGGCRPAPFVRILERSLRERGADSVAELETEAVRALAREYLSLVPALSGEAFPQDPMRQLMGAVEAVFRSWNSPRAREYRRLGGLDDSAGTAVTIQAMVFGNAGGTSGAGVGFTRDPASGEDALYVDYLPNAQGEDVVAGRRHVQGIAALERLLPAVRVELERVRAALEAEFRDVQDFEFTVDDGRLYLLQTRAAKRTPWAAVRIAVEQVRSGLIDPEEALKRLADLDLNRLERLSLVPGAEHQVLATATSAGIGVATGPIALDVEAAKRFAEAGRAPILLREHSSTEDIAGMALAAGILTTAGGRTSHAAVVARQLGKVCLVGCSALRLDLDRRRCRFGSRELTEGAALTLDGTTGRVYEGALPVVHERPEEALRIIEGWRDRGLGLEVRG